MYDEKFWLWIPKAEFDVVYGWTVLGGVEGQVLVSANSVSGDVECPFFYWPPCLRASSFNKVSTKPGQNVVDSPTKTGVSDLGFVS